MKFLRNLLATILGVFIACGLMFFILIAIGSSLSKSTKVSVKSNSVLELNLDNPLKDHYSVTDPFAELMGDNSKVLSLHQVIAAIENAKTDDNIKGISIRADYMSASLNHVQIIRDKLVEFKESGKFISAYSDVYGQANYYISSVADSVFVNPTGGIDLKGLGAEILFYKDFEDKYGVKMEVIRHGEYKSAVEPFISNKISEPNRRQMSELLHALWDKLKGDIATSRNLTAENVDAIADGLLSRNANLALENKVVDGIIYEDQYESKLKAKLEVEEKDKLNTISLAKYIKSGKGRIKSTAKDRVAVVYAQGEIKYGEGDETYIGQETMIKNLRKAVKDKNVKSIVLRVNSPGGSALASDIIWREIERTKKEKPVVVSMGQYAASGGYYISCNASKIYAEPTTITGSIGVFGMLPNAAEFVKEIGINAEQVTTNKHSVGYSLFEPIGEEFKKVTQESVEDIYTTFLDRVAAGRNMTRDQVDVVARGRVWSGVQAKEKGLVDEIGNLDQAVAYAAELAELTDFRVKNYPHFKKDFDDTFGKFPLMKANVSDILMDELGKEQFAIYQNMKTFSQMKGIQARMPFVMEIK